MLFVHGDLITEMIKVDEEILEVMNDILSISNKKNEIEKTLYDYLRMFLKKEKRLISKVPKDLGFIKFITENLNSMVIEHVDNPDNSGKIISRLSTLFNTLGSQIKPSQKYATVFVGGTIEQYDLEEEYNNLLISTRYNKLLMKRYLKSLEDMKSLDIYDDNLLAVQFLNLFIYNDITDEFSSNAFDFEKLSTVSDEQFILDNNMKEEDFFEMKYGVISENIMVLVALLLNNKTDSIDYLDAELNFKYLMSELSYDNLLELSGKLDAVFDNFIKNATEEQTNVISSLTDFIEKECSRKESLSKLEDAKIEYDSLTEEQHEMLVNLAYFEIKLLSTFDKLDFSSKENEETIDKLDNLLGLEKDLVNGLDSNSISITDLNNFLGLELKNILNQDYYDRDFRLINHRIGFLIPQFRNLFMSPSQSEISHDIILRNFLTETMRDYYDLVSTIEDEDVKENYLQLYKDRFYMYPTLTNELVSFKGNHLLVDSVSDDLAMEVADVEEIEYFYDVNEQLFKEAEAIIQEFSGFDISYFGSSYCQFRLIQFDYIVRSLCTEKLDNLFNMLCEINIDSVFKKLLSEMIESNLVDEDYDLSIKFSDEHILVKILKDNGDKK